VPVANAKDRFSSRVDDYVRWRPSYPRAAVDLLRRAAHLGPESVVADVGAGTGIFSRLLLETGARVFGVEPNAPMNQRKHTPFNRDYEIMLNRLAPDYANVRESDRAAESTIRDFFAPSVPSFASFDNEQTFDDEGLRGRLASSSYVPPAGHPLYEPILQELSRLYRLHAKDGRVTVAYDCIVWYGPLTRSARSA
jgi:SAM-dependent methyltransferase